MSKSPARNSHARLHEELMIKSSAIASAVNGMSFGDLKGRITDSNAAGLALFGGYTLEEVRGLSALSFADSQEEAAAIFADVIKHGSWTGEVAGRKKDGSPIIVHLSASLVRNTDGKPICTMCSFIDITRSKQAIEELRIKDYAIKSSISAIAIGNLNGHIAYINDSLLRLWGNDDPTEIIGRPITTFAQSEQEAEAILQSVLDNGNWMGEVSGYARDGRLLTVQLSAQMVTNDEGQPICLMCSFVDVTEKNLAQAALQKTMEELEERVAERTQELTEANANLRREIEERKLAEQGLLNKEKELQINALHLEESNIALKVLLNQREKDKNEVEENVLANVRGLLLPCLEKLRQSRLNDEQRIYVDILDTNLRNIVSPFMQRLSSQYMNLTPTEIQVAGLVREGKTSKEIASLINVSDRGIEFHRNNIRRKLGISQSKKNLRTYLLSLS
ncbi:MAG: PAS domain-containing protein [Smithella sp.]